MKRYTKPNDNRYQFMVITTLNGYSIEVMVVSTGDLAAITPSVAATLQIELPDGFRLQSCDYTDAEKELDRVAELNSWTEMK